MHGPSSAAYITNTGWKRRRRDDGNTIFAEHRGNRAISPTHAWRILWEACATNELTGKLGTHCPRKTFANKVYHQLGFDLIRTKRALSHQQISNTERYLSFAEAEIHAAILAI